MLLTFCTATLVGLLVRLEPDTILLRALTASVSVGLLVRIALGIVATPVTEQQVRGKH